MEQRPTEQNSPFPGMDPFIESCGLWEDFHDTMVTEIKKALAAVRSWESTPSGRRHSLSSSIMNIHGQAVRKRGRLENQRRSEECSPRFSLQRFLPERKRPAA